MNNDLEQKKEYSAPKMEIVQLRQESMLLADSDGCNNGTLFCDGEAN
ncbi:hypothetical protein [uncultured Fibrobacter sp.]|nr:hypothetical protein [uncultured Fibrobacter sp.]